LKTWTDPTKQQLIGQWPVPKGATPATDLKTWLKPGLSFNASLGVPFSLDDWPVPKGAIPAIDLKNFSYTMQYEIIETTPTAQFDWPVPKGYIPGISLRTWADLTRQQLIGQDAFCLRIVLAHIFSFHR
jgi:hypothetical protein